MTRARRLQPLVRIAARRAQAAAGELAHSRRRAGEIESRLAQLRAYRDEYEQQLQTEGVDGVSAERLKSCRIFIEQLNGAIREALERREAAHQHVNNRRGEWLSLHTRCRALEELVERARSTERLYAARREQREADDRAQRGPGEGAV